MWYLIMLAIPLLIYGIIWIIYWIRNYYSEYVYFHVRNREIQKGLDSIRDKRLPILYLRNFKVDGSKIENSEAKADIPNVKFKLNLPTLTLETTDTYLNQENLLRRKVSPIGPLISIGDFNPEDIGIQRIKSNNANWKVKVESYMKLSSMIILRTSSGLTPGVTWELNIILDKFLHKTLFFVESNNSDLKQELDRELKLKFPDNKQKEITDRIIPYYLWVSEDGKKNYPLWLRSSKFFRKIMKDSKKQNKKFTEIPTDNSYEELINYKRRR
jgi:hypothetical protein